MRRGLLFGFCLYGLAAALRPAPAVAAIPPPLVAPAERADRIVVDKGERRLYLMRKGAVIDAFSVALGSDPAGDKVQDGDGRTPDGLYTIDAKSPKSAYHLSLHISYPDAEDRAEAARRGVKPGGDIAIHGLPDGLAMVGALHRLFDWTNGCIAVTDTEIERIWARVAVGTPIEIKE